MPKVLFIRTLIYVIYCLVVVLLLLSSTASYAFTKDIALIQLAPSLDLLSLGVAFILMLVAALFRINPLFSTIVLITAFGLNAHRSLSINFDRSDAPSNLSVMSLNVQHFNNDTNAVREVVHLIQLLDPDVVALQEFGLYYQWPNVQVVATHFADQIGMKNYHFDPERGDIFGTAIFSKFPILSSEVVFYSKPSTNESFKHILNIDNQELILINTHLESYSFNSAQSQDLDVTNAKRIEQLESIMLHSHPGGKQILVGDFNVLPGSYIYERLAENLLDFQVRSGVSFSGTHHLLPVRLDYLFGSSDIGVSSFRTFELDHSDHKAILAHLNF